ncbi:MAG: outer membrane protein assembly factor BamD [Elusimicrobia bacterium]|nr:outer membrane protein assembly factor BamD [Elusimicrobiota bacterium]
MKRTLALGLLLGAAASLGGCVATQRDILDLENQTDELKHQVADLKTTISTMQNNQADLGVQMQRLQEGLTAFNETVRRSESQMSDLSSKIDDLAATIGNKVAAIGTTLTTVQAKSLDEQKAALASQLQQATPSELFQAAEVRLNKKSYELAAKGFEQYISSFPRGALADVATYDLGEAYYGLKKWKAAGRQFGIYLEKYPKSALTASARIKYALCLVNLRKNPGEARQYLESVIADFPSSPEAKAAARHLKTLAAAAAQKAGDPAP